MELNWLDATNVNSRTTHRSQSQINSEVFKRSESVEIYRDRAIAGGLTDAEEYILKEYFVEEGASVLDIGCGVGRVTKPLADLGFNVIGIDMSEPMIEAARETYSDIEFTVADVTELPYSNGAFEYTFFSSNGLDCIHPGELRIQALEEINRVLQPDGMFAFSAHNWLYAVPAIVSDFTHVRRYYLANGNLGRLLSPYKMDASEFNLMLYLGNPWRIKSQLESCGFELHEWVTKRQTLLKYFENTPHYVAKNDGR